MMLYSDPEFDEGDPGDFEPTEPVGCMGMRDEECDRGTGNGCACFGIKPRTMQPEVHEWLSHLEALVTDVIVALRASNKYTQLEDQLLLAQAKYREQMKNL